MFEKTKINIMTSKFNKFMKKIIICSIFITTCLLSLQAQTWQTLNNTNFLRHHTISFSINNMGYSIAGTTPQGRTSNVQEYDPVNDSWTDLGNYPGPARAQGIGQTWDGKGYFGFGSEPSGAKLNDLWEFDPISNTFTQLPSCPGVGRTHPALVILNGKIYTGMGSGTTNLSDWWEYDIATQVWTQKTSIPIGRHHPYQFILNGNIYVGSGHQSSWYKYDPLNDTWTAVASLDTRVAGTQFNYNGKGYALSGVTTGHTFYATGEFHEYDPLSDSWNILNPHPGNSLWAPASFVINNYVYIYTGTTGATGTSIAGTYSSSMYRYQLSNINNSSTDTQVACDSLRWIDNILYTANNTTATDTLTNFANGDSIVTLNLTIINSATGTDTRTECSPYAWIDGNIYTANNTTATFNLVGGAANSCDSLVTLDLTITNSTTGTDTRTECSPYVWIDGNIYTANNTTATFNLIGGAANSCDSLVTLDLTINPINITITNTSLTLTANQTGATYQWLDCDNGNVAIPSETSQSYTATTNGNYAVEVSLGSCVDTSACENISIVGINENILGETISIYPNPTSGVATINLGTIKEATITILNITGEELYNINQINESQVEVSLSDYSKGIYFIKIQSNNQQKVVKLIKQ